MTFKVPVDILESFSIFELLSSISFIGSMHLHKKTANSGYTIFNKSHFFILFLLQFTFTPMCYYTASKLSKKDIYHLEKDFLVKWEEEKVPELFSVSGYDHPKMPVITSEGHFKNYRWGLIPHWVKDWESAKRSRDQCLNSIGEEAQSKSSFRDVIKNAQFCVIPVNGFFEWHHLGKDKYPHYIYPKNEPYFLMAGLYNTWVNKAINEVHDTFTILTTKANERMSWIHNSKKRMPVILDSAGAKLWLDREIAYDGKKHFFNPIDSSLMSDHPISKLITSNKENRNSIDVMKPYEYPELLLG